MKTILCFLLAVILSASLAAQVAPTDARVPVAKTVTLTVTSDGTPPLAYRWFKDEVPLTSAVAGAVSDKLVLTNFNTDHGGLYHCVVSNEAGNTTSNKVQLVPVKAPSKSTISVNIAVGTVNP